MALSALRKPPVGKSDRELGEGDETKRSVYNTISGSSPLIDSAAGG